VAEPAPRPFGLTLPGLWAFLAVALPTVAGLEATIATNDLAYQIRTGTLMLHTHHLLRADTFTFTAFGRPWLDQQWGAQLLFDLVYRAGGWAGLALLRAALVAAIYLFVFGACRAAGAGLRRAAWLTVGGFLVSVGGLGLRPQLFGMALFALTVWLVFLRRRDRRTLWLVVPVTAVWANLHGSFFLAPLLVALVWLRDLHDRSEASPRTLAIALVSALAAALNPFGFRVWSYVVGLSTNPAITRFISEWQPPTIRDGAGAAFFVSVAAVCALLVLRRDRTPWPLLVMLGAFLLIGLEATRGIFWWALVVPPALVQVLPPERDVSLATPSALNAIIAGAVVALGVAFLPTWRAGSRQAPSPRLVSNAPVAMTRRLRLILRPGERFFDPVPWASWFELALPHNPVFIDPRIEIFPRAVLDQDLDVSAGRQDWETVLRRWRIDVVVADRGEQAQLIPIIERSPRWREVYQDGRGAIFVRAP
jgi:hypothetical protein